MIVTKLTWLKDILWSGLQSFFEKFLQVFWIFSIIFKSKHFWVYLQLKLSLSLKTVLSSVTTSKRYCKTTSNVFYVNKKINDKKIFLYVW